MTILEVEFNAPVKPRIFTPGQVVANHVEDGHAIHHSGFETEFDVGRNGFFAESAVGVRDGSFVSGDHMAAARECRADVRERGFAGGWIERGDFGNDVGLGAIQEFFHRGCGWAEAAIAVRGSVTGGVDSGDFERIGGTLALQECREGAAYIAVTD